MNHKTHVFHVQGMHCQSCVFLTESELSEIPGIHSAKSDLDTRTVQVIGDFGDALAEDIAKRLSAPLLRHGYRLSLERAEEKKSWKEFAVAIPIAGLFGLLYVGLQKAGLVNLVGEGTSYGTAFLIGIIASLSTCMAVVGGLVLSMSATFAKEGDRWRPQALFHIGRLASFFFLGGVIGAIGSAFTLSINATFILGLLVGLVMLVMGINLLDAFHWSKKLAPSLPKWIGSRALGISKLNHRLTPVLLGIVTFFLPCGFTQSMQVFTLSSGGFFDGGFTMLSYALGTLPVLALLSFSSYSVAKSPKKGIFFKSAGLVVIMFALFNIVNSLAVKGIIPPLFDL